MGESVHRQVPLVTPLSRVSKRMEAARNQIAHEKHQEGFQLRQEKQTLRDALKEVFKAIEHLQEQTKNLEGQMGVLQEHVKMLERQMAKDSPRASSDWFVRALKSLR